MINFFIFPNFFLFALIGMNHLEPTTFEPTTFDDTCVFIYIHYFCCFFFFQFDTSANLVIGTNGTTAAQNDLSTVTSTTTAHASGTLAIALTNSAVSTIQVRSALAKYLMPPLI